MTPLQRAVATFLLVGCILGGLLVPYSLAHGQHVVGLGVAGLIVIGGSLFMRIKRRAAGYSTWAAVVGAIIGLVVSGNIIVGTRVRRPGVSRTWAMQSALLLGVFLVASILAFLASHLSLGLDKKRSGRWCPQCRKHVPLLAQGHKCPAPSAS